MPNGAHAPPRAVRGGPPPAVCRKTLLDRREVPRQHTPALAEGSGGDTARVARNVAARKVQAFFSEDPTRSQARAQAGKRRARRAR